MMINIPQSDRRLIVDSEVVWINSLGPDHSFTPRGMGVQFTEISGVQFTEISGTDRQFLSRMILNRI